MAKNDGGRERPLHESEANFARRVEYERKRRGWSQERLAALMKRAGVPVHQSAISKIERTTDRRAISIDEGLAFARVFGIPYADMLRPVEAAMSEEIDRLWTGWWEMGAVIHDAREKAAEMRIKLGELLEANEDASDLLKEVIRKQEGDVPWIGEVPDYVVKESRRLREEQ